MQRLFDVLQPQYFEQFHCIGSECEDTCCDGWGILIDQQTHAKYQSPDAPLIGGRSLKMLVEQNPAARSARNFAVIRLEGTRCPALEDGMCSIQEKLGEPWISDSCSSYPRVLNQFQDRMERSLHLSCPEAARLVLANPDPIRFEKAADDATFYRPGILSHIDNAADDSFLEARRLMILILAEKTRPLAARFRALAEAIDRFSSFGVTAAPAILQESLALLQAGSFEITPSDNSAAATQLEVVVELVVGRISREYTSPRFLQCYGEFMRGLGWTSQSTMEQLANRYRAVVSTDFAQFLGRHPQLFENYLVNYVFRTLFPWGQKAPNQDLQFDSSAQSVKNSFVLMVIHFAIIRTLLIGIAALYGKDLTMEHAVKLIQSCTKTFQHSGSIRAELLEYLSKLPLGLVRRSVVLVAD